MLEYGCAWQNIYLNGENPLAFLVCVCVYERESSMYACLHISMVNKLCIPTRQMFLNVTFITTVVLMSSVLSNNAVLHNFV